MIARLFKSRKADAEPSQPASVPAGVRVYAFGDIHGRLDLFDQLLDIVEADDRARGQAETHIILLGDLVDRGPDSAGVVERAIQLSQCGLRFDCLMGNHEEVFLESFSSAQVLRFFLRIGGRETILSYPITLAEYRELEIEALQVRLNEIVPQAHRDFLSKLTDQVRVGDYLFVHAGIRPGVGFDEQRTKDLRWIRDDFLDDERDHGAIIVHGHTITESVEECTNRIGIDTGAYMSGELTAIGLEGSDRWYLSTGRGED